MVETRLRDDQTITMLVNNAGTGSVAPLHSVPAPRYRIGVPASA
jgi:short-subunit dehydrogenase